MTMGPEVPGDQPDDRIDDTTGEHDEHDDRPAPDVGEDGEASPGSFSERFVSTPDDAEVEQIEADRAARLDPDNRPDNVEVDNSERVFDPEKGMFTDDEGYDAAPKQFPAAGEQDV